MGMTPIATGARRFTVDPDHGPEAGAASAAEGGAKRGRTRGFLADATVA